MKIKIPKVVKPKDHITVLQTVEYDIVESDKKLGCKGCDLFGRECVKVYDSGERPSCSSPKNIIFKMRHYYPDGNKSIVLPFPKKEDDKEEEKK